ncbi:hypothetical protein ANTQUA_LOCUS574 [Anthophora quadrimaculata]
MRVEENLARSDLVFRTWDLVPRSGRMIGRYCATTDLHDSEQRYGRLVGCHGTQLSSSLFVLHEDTLPGQKNDTRRRSRYECEDCDVGLCVVSCFKIYHTQLYY